MPATTTTQRGYGWEHQKKRRALAPFVATGQAHCTEHTCLKATRRIQPDEPWDLAHDRRTPGTYLGPAHQECNRAEGTRWAAHLAKQPTPTRPGWHSPTITRLLENQQR